MSINITEALIQQYKAGFDLNFQQTDSKMRGNVDQESVGPGTRASFDRIGKTFTSEATTRHEPTQQTDTDHNRRWVPVRTHRWNDYIDEDDIISVAANPMNAYARNAAMAFMRTYDDKVFRAAYDAATTGEEGDGVSGVPNSVTAAGTTVTLGELLAVKQRMDENEVPESGRHFIMHPNGFTNLLQIAEATSSDFVTIKALVQGEIDTWLGFQWHTSNRLDTTGNDTRCFAWHEDALKVGMARDVMNRVSQRDDLNYTWQVWFSLRFGAVRMEEEGVEILEISTSGS